MNRKILIFFFLSLLVPSLKAATPYEMGDLETLYKENNFSEFLNHALDIRPTLRDSKWKKMVLEMGVDFVKDKDSRKQYDEKKKTDLWVHNARPKLRIKFNTTGKLGQDL